MKALIISDGTPYGTRVFDVDAGSSLENVLSVEISKIEATKPITAKVTMLPASVHLNVEAKVLRSEEAHQSIRIGRFSIHKHDYDGDVLQLLDYGEEDRGKDPKLLALQESKLEALLRTLNWGDAE